LQGRPRTWLEWADKKGKLRLMCGAYTLEDGKTLEFYHIREGSVLLGSVVVKRKRQ
jgi:hypothetical protein